MMMMMMMMMMLMMIITRQRTACDWNMYSYADRLVDNAHHNATREYIVHTFVYTMLTIN